MNASSQIELSCEKTKFKKKKKTNTVGFFTFRKGDK